MDPELLAFAQKKYGEQTDSQEVPGSGVDPEIMKYALRRFGLDKDQRDSFTERVRGVGKDILSSLPINAFSMDPESQARSALAGAGFIKGAILQPLEALAELPGVAARFAGDVFERMGRDNGKEFLAQATKEPGRIELLSDSAVDFLIRAKSALYTDAEAFAKESGTLSDIQIADAYSVGNFIGVTAPISASIKGAGLLIRTKQTLSSWPLVGELITDVTAGALYGGVLEPGRDPKERMNNILGEAAAFGAFRIATTGLAAPLKIWRNKRLRDKGVFDALHEQLKKIYEGDIPEFRTEQDARDFFTHLSEENFIINSPQALDILQQGGETNAVFAGLIDQQERGTTGGFLTGFKDKSFPEMESMLDRLRVQFPGVKFHTLKGADGEYSVFYGSSGLNNKQRAQFKKYGSFEGQQVEKNGASYIISNPEPSKGGFLKVRTSDGKSTSLKPEGITYGYHYFEDMELPKAGDALYENFKGWVGKKSDELLTASGVLTEEQIIRGVRNGSIPVDDNLRRNISIGGAIVFPEEAGVETGEKAISVIRLEKTGEPAIPDVFGSTGNRAVLHKNTVPGEHPWRLTYFDEGEQVLGHQDFPAPQTALEAAGEAGWTPREAITATPTFSGTIKTILKEGQGTAGIMSPQSTATFDDLFDAWVKEKGLPEGSDYRAYKENFASRIREDYWKLVPEEDRSVFERVREEYLRLSNEGDIPVDSYAATKGFQVKRLEDGGVILRDINTGAMFRASNEREAREALSALKSVGNDLVPDLIPWDSRGIASVSKGFDIPESGWSFAEHMNVGDYLKDINSAISAKVSKNVRDLLIRLEEVTKLPLFSQGYDKIDRGYQALRSDLEPVAKQIQDIWSGIKKDRKEAIAQFWAGVEGNEMTLPQAVKEMKAAGFSSKEIRAFERSRVMFDFLYQIGREGDVFKRGQYINLYYTRVLPFVKEHGYIDLDQMFPGGNIPPEFKFWAEMTRTGELPMFETDPELVMHKYAYQLLWKTHVYEHWNKMADLVGTRTRPAMKIGDLPLEQQVKLLENNPQLNKNATVLPDPVIKTIQEYLNTIRGTPVQGFENLRKVGDAFFSRFGIEMDPRVMEEYHNILMSQMYGAAMAARPILVMRNMVQNYWLMYSRIGAKYASEGLSRSMTAKGLNEVIDAGAVRLAEAGIPAGDAFLKEFVTNPDMVKGKGPFSRGAAAMIRLGLKYGKFSKKAAEKLLVPYSSADQANRAWAYWWHKLFTAEHLEKFEKGVYKDWAQFEEHGLPFFSRTVKDEFTQTYKAFGKEKALQTVGKYAADESNFIYGLGTQPTAMQGPFGRLFGMFGTWPIWALEHYYRRMKLGTPRQKAAMVARTLSMVGVFSIISHETKKDLSSWMAPTSVIFSGGPFVDYAMDAREVITAPLDQKAAAAQRLASNVGRLWFPGQLAYRDFHEALDHDDPRQAALSLIFGRDAKKGNFAYDWFYSPDVPVSIAPYVTEPQTLQGDPVYNIPKSRTVRERSGVGLMAPTDYSRLTGNM